jgi:hypothetical protein
MQHAAALKLSLLMAMGIVPLACGGHAEGTPDEGTAGSGAGTGGSPVVGTGGSAGQVGTAGIAGTSFAVGACTSSRLDPATGLVQCIEGYQHRALAVSCTPLAGGFAGNGGASASSGAAAPTPGGAGGAVSCGSEVCGGTYPYCAIEGTPAYEHCANGCVTDSDCGPAQLCLCGVEQSPTGGVCKPSTCQTDGDCDAGLLCASYKKVCSNSAAGFACQSRNDTCSSDLSCGPRMRCAWSSAAGRQCEPLPACGRPFLVRAEARLPPVVATSAWLLAASPRVDHLSAAERAGLAEHWTKLGQMEHASIAAFARFSLQLLSLGAPPELVEACTQALADETAHTKLCFGIASAYAGRAIGPGPLDVSNSLNVTSLSDIVDLVIAEGCFGETSAALEALEAADSVSDPVIAAAYTQIARDEQRHAELAFRFVAWALEREPVAVRERIEAALRSDFAGNHRANNVAVPCLAALVSVSLAA